jgi:putative pyruvate formate lyase activating enzyme
MRIVTRNLSLAAQATRLIVRHLLLPGHLECCFRPIVDWMCRHLPATPFRVMAGYLPRWQAVRFPDLASPLGRDVGTRAVTIAREKGLNVIV